MPVEYHAIRQRFGERDILRDVSLCLPKSGVVLLSGKNGSGKSTLLRIMSGLLKPDAGEVIVEGIRKPVRRAGAQLLKQVMYLHQVPYLFAGSVRKNLAYALRGRDRDSDQRITQALEWVGLAHLADEDAKTLSGGERQRVALARALLCRPRVLLLDEPTAHLDAATNAQIESLLVELRAYTDTMLITSHEPGFLERLDGQAYRLEDGRLQALSE